MYANIYFNENAFYQKERVENIKKIATVDNEVIILTEKGDFIKFDTYVIESYTVVMER